MRKYYKIWIAFGTVNTFFCYEKPHEGYEWSWLCFLNGNSPKEYLQKAPVIRRSSLIILWEAGTIFRFSGLVLVLLGSDRYSWLKGQIKLSTSCNCKLLLFTTIYVLYILYYKKGNIRSLENVPIVYIQFTAVSNWNDH